ncbi:MAG: helix-turn-helix domain-containing protein [Ilumatobacteraceae bacterium]
MLQTFLENLGDVNTSAEQLDMHHNTFRYRLKRAVEVGGIKLDDPIERLALQVELSLSRFWPE